jgi:fused signal recognition particle receptor
MMEEETKSGWWQRLSNGLKKSRTNLNYQVKSIFSGGKLTEDDWETLEETLIGADVGMDTTMEIVEHVREKVKERQVFEADALMEILRDEIVAQLGKAEGRLDLTQIEPPTVFLVVGVNGTGKTTTIGKLARFFKSRPARVNLVAADTFRAAAIEQLQKWADRVDVGIVKHQRGADPAAVVYDAIQSMRAQGLDFSLVDTAGRLHTYVNLMEELKKIKRVAVREAGDKIAVKTLLVLDATTGQNGITQARLFHEAMGLDGLILTKLDGTAKGGIVLAVQRQLGIPILMVGTGEQMEDLGPFSAEEFAVALLG